MASPHRNKNRDGTFVHSVPQLQVVELSWVCF